MKNIIKAVLFTWVMHGCFTLDDVTSFLNKLTPEQSRTAKVISINSNRSFLGKWSTPYYVWYENGKNAP